MASDNLRGGEQLPTAAVTATAAAASAENEEADDSPRDAHVIAAIIKAMGVESYEDRVVNQLLELMYRYVCEVLEDAKVYAEHAGHLDPDVDDVKLAIQARISYSFSQPPSREVLLQLARERNSTPLPLLDNRVGLILPPPRHQLTAQNYQIRAEKRPRNGGSRSDQAGDETKPEPLESSAAKKADQKPTAFPAPQPSPSARDPPS